MYYRCNTPDVSANKAEPDLTRRVRQPDTAAPGRRSHAPNTTSGNGNTPCAENSEQSDGRGLPGEAA
jgi:hypothetical protein